MPAAAIHWDPADANVFSGTPKLYFDGTNASIGKMMLYSNLDTGEYGTAKILVTDDTLILSLDNTYGDDSAIFIKVDQAGRYTGKIANGSDTVTFDFTTTGTPTGITLTPASQDVTVGGTGSVTMALVDGDGNATAPTFTSTVSVTESGAGGGGPSPSSVNPGAQASADDTAWALGSVDIDDAALTAGTTTLTASGSGNLLGLSASASMTAAGGISDDTVVGMYVSAPSTGVWNEFDPATASYPPGALNSQVKAGTTSVTVTIDDTASNADGLPIRLKITPSSGGSATAGGKTATNSVPTYVDVTPSGGSASLDMTIGGASALAGGTVTVQQVNVNNTTAGIGANSTLTITQVVPTIYADGISVTPSGNSVAKLGDTTSVAVSVDDSLGDPASGQLVSAFRGNATLPNSANLLSYSTTGSDGSATVTVEGASGLTSGAAETYYFTVSGYGSPSYLSSTLTITYTTDGGVSWLTVVGATSGTSFGTDANGDVDPTYDVIVDVPDITGATGDTASTGKWTIADAEASAPASSGIAEFRVATDPANAFSVSMSDGLWVLCDNAALSSNMWDDGASSANCSSDDSVYVWGTKVGANTFTVSSGGKTATGTVVVTNTSDDAYNMALSPTSQSLGAGAIGTIDVVLTDMFGNPVTASADDTGVVNLAASGEVLFAGYETTKSATPDEGIATVTIIAGRSGTGTISATPSKKVGAWATGFEAPTGIAAPVTSASAEVKVSESATKSITITGSRGTVKGKPGVMVDGLTTGFDEGAAMVPYIKFPGETAYSEGTARPKVDAEGEFYWQRKTGKKIYVYFKNEDGTVKSERIIIQAK